MTSFKTKRKQEQEKREKNSIIQGLLENLLNSYQQNFRFMTLWKNPLYIKNANGKNMKKKEKKKKFDVQKWK